MKDSDFATIAALKSLSESMTEFMAAAQLSNTIIMQVLVNVLERRFGPEVRAELAQGLRETWEVSHISLGADHPIAEMTQDTLQEFINSLEGK